MLAHWGDKCKARPINRSKLFTSKGNEFNIHLKEILYLHY